MEDQPKSRYQRKTSKRPLPVARKPKEEYQVFDRKGIPNASIYQGDIDNVSLATLRKTPGMIINSSAGYKRKYETPADLSAAILGYINWARQNPWVKNELIRGGQLAGQTAEVQIERPLSVAALCIHIGIGPSTWTRYREDPKYYDFHDICEWAEQLFRTQKLEGAIVGVYNHNIVSRDLKLADQTEGKNEVTITAVTGMIIKGE